MKFSIVFFVLLVTFSACFKRDDKTVCQAGAKVCDAAYPYVILSTSSFNTGDSVIVHTCTRNQQFNQQLATTIYQAQDYLYDIKLTDTCDYIIELPAKQKKYTVHCPPVLLDTLRTKCATKLFAYDKCVTMPKYVVVNGDTTQLHYVQYQCQLRL